MRSSLTLFTATFLVACSASSPRVVSTPVRPGMSSAQLLAAFGHPLRTERHTNGSEDWFYNFGMQQHESHPISESSVSGTEQTLSIGHATSTTTTMSPAPIHLSPAGRVVGVIPTGSVVVE